MGTPRAAASSRNPRGPGTASKWPVADGDQPKSIVGAAPLRVIIVDDHSMVRQGLRMFLAIDPDIVVIGEADSGTAAIQLVRELDPDVALMDILMPGMDGVTATTTIRQQSPRTEIIILTSAMEPASVVGSVRAGAIGYLRKDTEAEDLCRAIHAAAAGQVQLSPEAAACLMHEMRVLDSPETLSDREMEILRLLVRGQTNKEIALQLHIGEKTVKTHMSNIMAKLGVQSRTQAALQAVHLGLVSQDTSTLAG